MEECIYCGELGFLLNDGMCKECASGKLNIDEVKALDKTHWRQKLQERLDTMGRVDKGGPSSTQWEYEQMMTKPLNISPDFFEGKDTKELSEFYSDCQAEGIRVFVKRDFDEMLHFGPDEYKLRMMKKQVDELMKFREVIK